jgi:hypothetical protein
MGAPRKLDASELVGATFGNVISGTPPAPPGAREISPSDIRQDDEDDRHPGVAGTIALNATNLFGAAPALSGLITHLVTNEDYAGARDRYQRLIERANAENPISSYVGKAASLIPETVLGGALGKAAGIGAKALGIGSRVAEAGGIGSAIGKGVLGGAAYGAAGGAGEAISHGQSVLPAAGEGALVGGAAGGVLGAAGHGLSRVLAGAEDKQVGSLVQGVAKGVLPRERKLASRLASSVVSEGETEAGKAGITSADALIENRRAIRAAASRDPAKAQAGIQEVQMATDALEAAKEPHYAKLDEALGGGTDARAPVDALENRASVLQGDERKVVLDTAKLLREKYSTVNTDVARQLLERAVPAGDQGARDALESFAARLPIGQNWNTNRFIQALAEKGNIDTIDPGVREQIQKLPFKFDGTAKIASRDLRADLTKAQDEAATAMGTINATKNAQLADLGRTVLNGVVNRELDKAAGSSVPGIAKTVQAIREINVRQHTLIAIKKFASQQLDKATLAKQGIGPAKMAGNLIEGGAYAHAGYQALQGNIPAAAASALTGTVAHVAPEVAQFANRVGTDKLAWLAREARLAQSAQAAGRTPTEGGIKAMRVLQSLQAVGNVGMAGAGALGAAHAGTAAQ